MGSVRPQMGCAADGGALMLKTFPVVGGLTPFPDSSPPSPPQKEQKSTYTHAPGNSHVVVAARAIRVALCGVRKKGLNLSFPKELCSPLSCFRQSDILQINFQPNHSQRRGALGKGTVEASDTLPAMLSDLRRLLFEKLLGVVWPSK